MNTNYGSQEPESSDLTEVFTKMILVCLIRLITSIRKVVYRCGYRPRYGSIFYSPSMDWLLYGQAAQQAFYEGVARPRKINTDYNED